jgi:hypothetical protein
MNNANNTTKGDLNQLRQKNGKYGHSLDAVCICGRRKGQHDSVAPFPFGEYDGGPDCDGIKKAK